MYGRLYLPSWKLMLLFAVALAWFGGGSQTSAEPFGVGGAAKRVAIVIDGPLDNEALLKRVTSDVIDIVKGGGPDRVCMVVFSGPKEPTIIEATSDGQDKLIKRLTAEFKALAAPTGGGKRMVAAIEKAVDFKPQLVILMSRNPLGEGKDALSGEALLLAIGKPKMNFDTYSLLEQDKAGPNGKSVMEAISKLRNGLYHFISKSDLGLE